MIAKIDGAVQKWQSNYVLFENLSIFGDPLFLTKKAIWFQGIGDDFGKWHTIW